MTRKILQWRHADRERFKSVHWVTTKAKDDRELVTLTGIVVTDLKGDESGEWQYEDVVLGFALPPRLHSGRQGLPGRALGAIRDPQRDLRQGDRGERRMGGR